MSPFFFVQLFFNLVPFLPCVVRAWVTLKLFDNQFIMDAKEQNENTAPRDETDSNEGVYVVKQGIRIHHGEDGSDSSLNLKTTKDGNVVLIPQPSDDPEDPLNWSQWKKNAVFLSLLPGCFLTDWVITWGTTLFEAQAMDWKVSLHPI